MRLPILVAATMLVAGSVASAQPGRRGSIPIQAGEQCPAGMTEIRPRLCQAPEFPAPSIVDYRPRNTLKVAEHAVPRPKYPAIDYHAHVGQFLGSADQLAVLSAQMDTLGLGMMVVADN